jgi:hypothetical protein
VRHTRPTVEDYRVVLGPPGFHPAEDVLNVLSDFIG